MRKKQLSILIAAIVVIMVFIFLYFLDYIAVKNTVDITSLSSWSKYAQISRPTVGVLQINVKPQLSENTVVDDEQIIDINKDGFEINVQMSATSLKDNSFRSPNIILKEAKSSQTYPLELQVGIDNARHLQVAFIDLNQSDPYKRRVYLVSNTSATVSSDKLRIVERSSANTQSFSFYDGNNNSPLAENINPTKPFFKDGSSLKVGLYLQSGDYDGATMKVSQFKLIKNSNLPHL